MKMKNLFSRLHFFATLALALAIAVFVYLILETYHYRFDLSRQKVYSLSPQTLRILDVLAKEPIRVTAFFRETQPSRAPFENLLKEYAYHHRDFHYEFVDPDRSPVRARRYGVDQYETVVVEARGKREKTRRFGEETMTNLLAKLLLEEPKNILFATGYGAPSLEDVREKSGFGLFKQALLDANYIVRETVLSRAGVPEGTDLLVLAGPHVDLLNEELEVIRTFFDGGGGVLFLVDPVDRGEGKNLELFLSEHFGVQLGNDVVVDKISKLFGADYLIPLVSDYKPHAMTQGFRLASFFPIARSVRSAKEIPPALEVTEIAWTGAGSWAETDLKNLEEGTAEFSDQSDQAGPLPIAAAVSKKKGRGRALVLGDSDFINNGHLNLSGNKDFILNAVAWLTGDDLSITIRPRERETTPLFLNEDQQAYLFYGPVLTPPLIFLTLGAGVFFFRRRFH